VRRRPYSVVLFDELEKASPDVTNILLQILEDGKLTDATGRQVNFKNTLIIMTSNVGAKLIEKNTRFGFVSADNADEASYESMKTKLQEELKKEFRPEFLNRIDDTVVFRALNKDDIKKIIDIMLHDLNERLAERKMAVHLDDAAKEFVVEKGFDEKHGARPLRRAIQQHVEDSLADLILSHELTEEGDVFITRKTDSDTTLTFSNKPFKAASKKSKEREKELVETA
jgi:ATP-dependent Clp protease ATP-binding subunit ClpC